MFNDARNVRNLFLQSLSWIGIKRFFTKEANVSFCQTDARVTKKTVDHASVFSLIMQCKSHKKAKFPL